MGKKSTRSLTSTRHMAVLRNRKRRNHCCGSMTFWGGSGSADPCLWLMDPDSDLDPGSGSCYFRHWPSRCQQKTNFFTQFFSAYYFLKLHLHHFSKIKSQKESQSSRNQGFSYYFCIIIEGSGSGSRAGSGSGSTPLTSGSGSWRPKNMWIRWIRIRNTGRNRNFLPLHNRNRNKMESKTRRWQVSRDGILERQFYSRFLTINLSLLRLEFLSGILPSFFCSTKCYSWKDSGLLVSRTFLYEVLKP